MSSQVALTAAAAVTAGSRTCSSTSSRWTCLGLHADPDKVQLDVTGNPQGGLLGSLFCKLADNHTTTTTTTT